MASNKRQYRSSRNEKDTFAWMLSHAIREILHRLKRDRTYDIPYLAGYNRDGRTIYIDRHLPKTFKLSAQRIHD